ncbi:MAG TPA: tyrosine-type recombinase/integrase [Streptosporangiaceae bacterium]
MAKLTVINGDGELSPTAGQSERHKPALFCSRAGGPGDLEVCPICGTPHRDRCRLLGRHLRHLELLGRSACTVYERRRMLTRLGAWLAKNESACVADATPEQLYAWRESLRVADATAASYISSVKMFFGWMAAEGIRGDDPSAQIPAPVTPRRLPRPISEADLMAALDAVPAQDPRRLRLMIVLMAWCGLRCKEVALLRRENIRDTAENPVLVVVAGSSKGKKERGLPLSDFVVAEIRAAQLPQRGYVFPRFDGPGPAFHGNQHVPGRNGGTARPLAPHMVSKLIGTHLHECGIAASGHQLRHRYGTQAYAVSEDLIAVQHLMGHAHISTTTGYVEVAGKKGKDIVSRLPVPKLRIVKEGDSA